LTPKHQNTIDCSKYQHGCCQNNEEISAASGPNQAGGCPPICQCNLLGKKQNPLLNFFLFKAGDGNS
jgi:hypothetical protein